MRLHTTLFLLLLLAIIEPGFAQSFRDPTVPQQFQTSIVYINGIQAGDPSDYVNTASLPAYGLPFNCNIYRVKGYPLTGYVDIYAGTSDSQLNITLLSTTRANINSSTNWIAIANSNYEYANVGGAFNLTAAQAGNNTGLYAAYFAANSVPPTSPPTPKRVETSTAVRLARYTSAPSPPNPYPTTNLQYRDYMPCNGTAVACFDQTISYGDTPMLLKGRVLAYNGQKPWEDYLTVVSKMNQPAWANGKENEIVKWQNSSDNINWVDSTPYSTATAAGQENFQPGPIYATTYYRRVSMHFINSFYEDWYISNTVTVEVIPCKSDVYVQRYLSRSGITKSGGNIYAGYDIPGSNRPLGNVYISSSDNVTFVAEGSITLLPGFSVSTYATFSAYLSTNICSTLLPIVADPIEESSISKGHTDFIEPSSYQMSSSDSSEKMGATLAYPNPVSDALVIPSDTQSAILLNGQGQTVRTAERANQLNVQDLPEGLYNLQMYRDGKQVNQHIQIKH